MIELRVSEESPAVITFEGVQRVAEEHPGDHELTIVLCRASPLPAVPGEPGVSSVLSFTRLTLGERWRYAGTVECLEALSEFGEPTIVADG